MFSLKHLISGSFSHWLTCAHPSFCCEVPVSILGCSESNSRCFCPGHRDHKLHRGWVGTELEPRPPRQTSDCCSPEFIALRAIPSVSRNFLLEGVCSLGHIRDAQGLFLALSLEVTPGEAWGTICGAGG